MKNRYLSFFQGKNRFLSVVRLGKWARIQSPTTVEPFWIKLLYPIGLLACTRSGPAWQLQAQHGLLLKPSASVSVGGCTQLLRNEQAEPSEEPPASGNRRGEFLAACWRCCLLRRKRQGFRPAWW